MIDAQQTGEAMAIEVRPITATLGAEISGVDMADVSGETLEQMRKAWLDHKVLVLRDQHISIEEHIAFGRRFGDLEVHPFVNPQIDGLGFLTQFEKASVSRQTMPILLQLYFQGLKSSFFDLKRVKKLILIQSKGPYPYAG